MAKTQLSILIPVRNEGINIKIMLKFLRAVVDVPCEILVIHDSPDDETVPVVKSMQDEHPHVKLVHNDLGNALRAGVSASEGEIILIFAADEVGPVIAINDMLSLINEECDLVSCTRYAYGGRRLGGSLIGGVLSRIANKMFCALSGSVLTDATTGIKMFRKKIFDCITLEAEPVGWAVVFELAIKAQIEGMKLGEVPIISIDRLYGGESTFSLGPWVKEYFKWFLWGVRNLHLLKSEKPLVRKCLYR
jgi:glycosyltransferase involved in cell wall biosynthesis